MLSFRLGRHAIKQLNPSSTSILHRVEALSRVVATSNSAELPIRCRPIDFPSLIATRGIATEAAAAKPKAHTGRTAARKTTTAKKAVPKKRTAKKTTKKPAKKAKKAAKPKKPRVKKVQTPEEKQKVKIRQLKKTALNPPHGLPATAWNVLSSESTKGATNLVGGVKEASVKYKNLLPEEREHYNHLANENKAKNNDAYKAWIESYTPDQIRIANNARVQLRKISGHPRKWTALKDKRQLKRPTPPRLLFNKDRWASGDFNGMKVTEVPQLILREWAALPASQKQAYEDQYQQAKEHYHAERVRVYGDNSRPARRRRAVADSTAASAQLQREAATR